MDNRAVEEYKLQHAKEEGIQIGKAEGKAEGEYSKTVEIAKKMLSEDCNISLIAAITGLDEPFILSLKK